jgi:hypothetical protein
MFSRVLITHFSKLQVQIKIWLDEGTIRRMHAFVVEMIVTTIGRLLGDQPS